MSVKTQNQERAGFVLGKVHTLEKSSYAKKLSSYIMTNGLLPTLAFIRLKDEKLYPILVEWLQKKVFKGGSGDILDQLAQSDSAKLRIATFEILELANWIKRLVESKDDPK